MEDADIIALYQQRDERAAAETEKKYGSYCTQIARSILRDPQDVAETVNEAYLAVWQSIPPNEPASFPAYIGRITRTIGLKRLRTAYAAKRGAGEAAEALDELAEVIRGDDNTERDVEARELRDHLNQFLKGLPEPDRSVFVCRYWYFDKISEIAARFGFSGSKVKSMLLRTRTKLRQMLREEDLL
ncbi:MAG: sigma-70 family RNA polymerase sigma factor [Oscillospiraceae bacterium]|nr:sigma-70 family RNA polymerase sigma factor [Oscillospiraceae bacterium]